jgi:hypothetical protein
MTGTKNIAALNAGSTAGVVAGAVCTTTVYVGKEL